MKVHIGVDADTGLVHSMSTTAANAHDVTEAHDLLHGGEKVVWCEPGIRECTSGRKTWGGRDWQVGGLGSGGNWSLGAMRRWPRRRRRR